MTSVPDERATRDTGGAPAVLGEDAGSPPEAGAPRAAAVPDPVGTAPRTQADERPAVGRPAASPARRLRALDAARGLAIVVMLVVMNPGPAGELPAQLHHPDWHGLTFADLFFPLFLFAVGIAMTLSPRGGDARHVLFRAGVLLVIGIALGSLKHEKFALTGVLQHIAGAYVVAVAVLRAPRRWQLPVTVGMLVAYWLAFVVGAPGDDPWAQSGTVAHRVDETLLPGFTSEGTLQTLISAVTVLGGAFTGRVIAAVADRRELLARLAGAATVLIAAGLVLATVVPVNKRLWTPSFTVLTLGTSLAWLALGTWLIDLRGARRSTAPLVHLGANPIAIYVGFFASLSLLRNYGDDLTPDIAPGGSIVAGAFVYAATWTALWWLIAYLLYRRRIYIKI